ncbi:MAG: hypothetical protein HYZ89_03135 [Candidatus Omnitrophica bacterium]|nr:hypothetical protein [Candidatus Omnitrophota bacterium]
MTTQTITKEVIEEIRSLPAPALRELRSYAYFLKSRRAIDPTQLYFWTKRWQRWEQDAEADKHAGRLVGDGTLPGLLKALKRR